MAKEEIITCDIKDREHSKSIVVEKAMQVIFTTDQNEGRAVDPYLSIVKIDICSDCLKEIITKGVYIHAYGAMGYNDYYLKKEK